MKKAVIANPEPKSELPVIKSIGMHKVQDNLWTVLTIYSQGESVVKVEATEPNLREITISELKIAVMKKLIDETVDL